ncbi:hypothetical protein D3C85_1307050 [compost metagenome]
MAVPYSKSYPIMILVKLLAGLGIASTLALISSGFILSFSFTTQKSLFPILEFLSLDEFEFEVPANKYPPSRVSISLLNISSPPLPIVFFQISSPESLIFRAM